MPRITAVIITKNEERNIGRCLSSLKDVVEEVIVIDSFSEDRTKSICEKQGARVIEKAWMGFAKTKNFGNQNARNEYILWVDADEALSPELQRAIIAQKEKLKGAYTFNRRNFYCGKKILYGGWYPDINTRLFPKSGSEWVGDFVHEKLQLAPTIFRTHLSGDLLHYSYYNVGEHFRRAKKYAMLAAGEIASSKQKQLALKAIFSPLYRFVKGWILQGGILDGYYGFVIAWIGARENWWKYSEAIRLRNAKQKSI